MFTFAEPKKGAQIAGISTHVFLFVFLLCSKWSTRPAFQLILLLEWLLRDFPHFPYKFSTHFPPPLATGALETEPHCNVMRAKSLHVFGNNKCEFVSPIHHQNNTLLQAIEVSADLIHSIDCTQPVSWKICYKYYSNGFSFRGNR